MSKLNRSQKASLLKEIGNLISYFQTFEHMDVDKFINIMKEKYSSWKDVNVEELHDDVNAIVTTIQKLVEEKVVETDTNNITNVNNYNNSEIKITGGNASTAAEQYLSSELAVFEDEQILIDKDLENLNKNDTFTFTGFSTDDYQQTNAISISPAEFWSDEEKECYED